MLQNRNQINQFENQISPTSEQTAHDEQLNRTEQSSQSEQPSCAEQPNQSVQSVLPARQTAVKKSASQLENLLPRRLELFAVISEHPYVSFDTLARRFVMIPRRTLAYDVACLVKDGFVTKHGVTRGVCYSVKNS